MTCDHCTSRALWADTSRDLPLVLCPSHAADHAASGHVVLVPIEAALPTYTHRLSHPFSTVPSSTSESITDTVRKAA